MHPFRFPFVKQSSEEIGMVVRQGIDMVQHAADRHNGSAVFHLDVVDSRTKEIICMMNLSGSLSRCLKIRIIMLKS